MSGAAAGTAARDSESVHPVAGRRTIIRQQRFAVVPLPLYGGQTPADKTATEEIVGDRLVGTVAVVVSDWSRNQQVNAWRSTEAFAFGGFKWCARPFPLSPCSSTQAFSFRSQHRTTTYMASDYFYYA